MSFQYSNYIILQQIILEIFISFPLNSFCITKERRKKLKNISQKDPKINVFIAKSINSPLKPIEVQLEIWWNFDRAHHHKFLWICLSSLESFEYSNIFSIFSHKFEIISHFHKIYQRSSVCLSSSNYTISFIFHISQFTYIFYAVLSANLLQVRYNASKYAFKIF